MQKPLSCPCQREDDSYDQKPHKLNTLHYNTFHALIEVVEHHGGTLCRDKVILENEFEFKKLNKDYDLKIANMVLRVPIEVTTRDKELVITFLKRLDRDWYSAMIDNLEN